MKSLGFIFLTAAVGVAFAYTWLGTGLGDVERRLSRRVMGFYGRYGQWPTSVTELEHRMRPHHVQSVRAAARGRTIDFEKGPMPDQLTIVVNGLLPWSGMRIIVSSSNKAELQRNADIFYAPLPEQNKPGMIPESARWM